MKRCLMSTVLLVLGVSANTYAANPFSDVPAGHWSYDSINKLKAAGVINGYGDTTFCGAQLMTRYEMAQIIAKAMAKGANVDKLAAEYAEELENLGVRVNNLEQKADNVKVSGEIRYHYADKSGSIKGIANNLRSRIWITGQLNDDWSYTGKNNQDFTKNTGDEETKFQRAYVEGRIGGLHICAGRIQLNLIDGNLYDTRAEGGIVTYGDDVKLTVFCARPTDQVWDLSEGWNDDGSLYVVKTLEYYKAYGVNVAAQIGSVRANAGYTILGDNYKVNSYFNAAGENVYPYWDLKDIGENNIWNVGVAADITKDLKLTADYMKSDKEYYDADDALIVGLSYGGAMAEQPGSFGLRAKYYNQARTTVVTHTMNGVYGSQGFKGYMLGADYALAKNIIAGIEYYDLENKVSGADMKTLWSQLIFVF